MVGKVNQTVVAPFFLGALPPPRSCLTPRSLWLCWAVALPRPPWLFASVGQELNSVREPVKGREGRACDPLHRKPGLLTPEGPGRRLHREVQKVE